MTEPDKDNLRQHLRFTESLLRAMEFVLQGEDPDNIRKYGGFKQFAHKYMQIVELLAKTIELPEIFDFYDIKNMPVRSSTRPGRQKEIFESVYANLSLLRALLETEIGIVDDEIRVLPDFFNLGCVVPSLGPLSERGIFKILLNSCSLAEECKRARTMTERSGVSNSR